MSRGAACPDKPPPQADQPHTRCKASCFTPIQLDRSPLRGPPVKSVKTLGVMHDPGYMHAEADKWGPVIKAANITLE